MPFSVSPTTYPPNFQPPSKKAEQFLPVTPPKPEIDQTTKNQAYLDGLRRKNPDLNIHVIGLSYGANLPSSRNKVDVSIDHNILFQMANNPDAAKRYEDMLAGLSASAKLQNNTMKSTSGNEIKYRQVWIDRDGNMSSFTVTGPTKEHMEKVQKEKLSRKLKAAELLKKRKAERKKSEEALQQRILRGKIKKANQEIAQTRRRLNTRA